MPAWICKFEFNDQLTGIESHWLQPNGEGKAQVVQPRKQRGRIRGSTCRLNNQDADLSTLAVAEGVVTGLSFTELTGLPTFATGSVGNFKNFAPPPETRSIVVAADRGFAGEREADALASRLMVEGYHVEVHLPPSGCGDFNDLLREQTFV